MNWVGGGGDALGMFYGDKEEKSIQNGRKRVLMRISIDALKRWGMFSAVHSTKPSIVWVEPSEVDRLTEVDS